MKIEATKEILAIVTLNKSLVWGGGAPIFLAKDPQELEQLCTYLARIFASAIHDLDNGVNILVKH